MTLMILIFFVIFYIKLQRICEIYSDTKRVCQKAHKNEITNQNYSIYVTSNCQSKKTLSGLNCTLVQYITHIITLCGVKTTSVLGS